MPNKLEEMFATDITEYILKIGKQNDRKYEQVRIDNPYYCLSPMWVRILFVYYFIPTLRTVIGLHQARDKHMQNKGRKTSRRKTNAYLNITNSSTLFVIKNKQFKICRQYFWPIRLGDIEKTDGGTSQVVQEIRFCAFKAWGHGFDP